MVENILPIYIKLIEKDLCSTIIIDFLRIINNLSIKNNNLAE